WVPGCTPSHPAKSWDFVGSPGSRGPAYLIPRKSSIARRPRVCIPQLRIRRMRASRSWAPDHDLAHLDTTSPPRTGGSGLSDQRDQDAMTGTLAYVGQRALLIAFTALAVSSIVFIGIHQLPGDAFVSERLRPSQQAALLHQFGLDRPLWVQ